MKSKMSVSKVIPQEESSFIPRIVPTTSGRQRMGGIGNIAESTLRLNRGIWSGQS
jgi:hypothetical protein